MLRIVAGEFGSRRIEVPRGSLTRPTAERVREALFSMLGPLSGERVLDLFGGSGALGIEAVSRGAAEAVFVDSSPVAVSCMRGNLDSLGIEARVLKLDWTVALADLERRGDRFDLVFADPPYSEADSVFERLSAALEAILAPQAVVVCESGIDTEPVSGMRLLRERRHGDTLLRLYGND